jgi:hypothetical protein
MRGDPRSSARSAAAKGKIRKEVEGALQAFMITLGLFSAEHVRGQDVDLDDIFFGFLAEPIGHGVR